MKKIILIIIFYLFLAQSVQAAVLYFETDKNQYELGDTFLVDLRIDTEECINAFDVKFNFAKDLVAVKDVSLGESIITLWLEEPKIGQGTISFSGGIPGGYCGIISGDPGRTNLLARIIFKSLNLGTVEINFNPESQVLLNDGLATKADLTLRDTSFRIVQTGEPVVDEWQYELDQDLIMPESFEIKLAQDDSLFEGKHFIIFFTTDKQTGIDYYEVKEGDNDWKRVKSPYLLKDQSLTSAIRVRAVDKAGNTRISELEAAREKFAYWYWIVVLAALFIIWLLYKQRKLKND